MKATTITMQIVKNLGNYEMVRLEATYTLTEMEADHIEDAFVNARGQLERAFKKAYNKTEIERVEKGAIEKIALTDKRQISRVLKAVKDVKLSIEEVRGQFEITDELKDFFKVNEIEL
jgi:inhibitor of KinA sporulation pathway (predicted exonuclease)